MSHIRTNHLRTIAANFGYNYREFPCIISINRNERLHCCDNTKKLRSKNHHVRSRRSWSS